MSQSPRGRKAVETLEPRLFLSASPARPATPYQHVLMVSVDGLHQADVTDPNLKGSLSTILSLKQHGVSYSHASTTRPSDSFPGTLSYLTGALPGTTGVYYDDSYSRTLFAPGSNPKTAKPGTEVLYAENLDKNQALLSGGGNFDASSIDPANLPLDSNGNPVYPHSFLKVNTIFNVARDAGLYTAFSDKHPAYEIANGPSGNGLNEFFAPEVNSNEALLDPTTGQTVSADALQAANPFTDVSKYKLVDASNDPQGPNDPNLELVTNNVLLTEKYDDVKVQGILNEIDGLNPQGTQATQVPNLFGFNFQEVSVAQKYYKGGVNLLPNGQPGAPSDVLKAAIAHTDASIGKIVSELQAKNLWSNTLIEVTAKHGQTPRVGYAGLLRDSTLPDLLAAAGAPVAQATQDDVSLIYLQDQSKTSTAVAALENFKNTGTIDAYFQGVKQTLPASQVINQILSGPSLAQYGLGNPLKDSTTPDIIVTLKPGYIWVGNPLTKFPFKRAEHGGFSADDTHVPLILGSGTVPTALSGQVISQHVATRQMAVTTLLALGLNPAKLQGAATEHTQPLPIFHSVAKPGHGANQGQNQNNDNSNTNKSILSLFNGLEHNKKK